VKIVKNRDKSPVILCVNELVRLENTREIEEKLLYINCLPPLLNQLNPVHATFPSDLLHYNPSLILNHKNKHRPDDGGCKHL
jgi:hypothetical protein